MHGRKRAVLAGASPGSPTESSAPWLLANSDWTLARARELAPPGSVVEPVRLAFPTAVFRPGDRAALRRTLGLPPDDVLILVSSVIVDGPDKGFADLRAALQAVAGPGVGVVAIGRLDDPARLGVANLFAPGLIADEAVLAAWYGACDLHVTASRHETLGQTPIEAGLCGVPTLAYRTSGLTSAVIDGVSGRLVPVRPGALAEALAALVGDREAPHTARRLRAHRPGEPLQPGRVGAVAGRRLPASGSAERRDGPALRPRDARTLPVRGGPAAGRGRHRPDRLAPARAPAAAGQADGLRAADAAPRAPVPLPRRRAAPEHAVTASGADAGGARAAPGRRRIYLDQTHLRDHVTGIERVTLDLFAPDRLAPHAVRPVTAGSLPGMIAAQQLGPAGAGADGSGRPVPVPRLPARAALRRRGVALPALRPRHLPAHAEGGSEPAQPALHEPELRPGPALVPEPVRQQPHHRGGRARALLPGAPASRCCGRPSATPSAWRTCPDRRPTRRAGRCGSWPSAPSSRARTIRRPSR